MTSPPPQSPVRGSQPSQGLVNDVPNGTLTVYSCAKSLAFLALFFWQADSRHSCPKALIEKFTTASGRLDVFVLGKMTAATIQTPRQTRAGEMRRMAAFTINNGRTLVARNSFEILVTHGAGPAHCAMIRLSAGSDISRTLLERPMPSE